MEQNSLNDTICAVSTAPGIGGIAVVRVSGPDAIKVVDRVWHGLPIAEMLSHTAHLGEVLQDDGSVLDQAVATIFRGPKSYTGEDVIELSVHGSIYVQRALIESLCKAGARLAEQGEFTKRAYTNGRIDLVQAEAIADIIASRSRGAQRLAISQMRGGVSKKIAALRNQLIDLASLLELELDFSEEDVEFADRSKLLSLARQTHAEIVRLLDSFSTGKAIKDGIPTAIVGETNAGKSSLLNALLGDDKAIVSPIHGTTRDVVEDILPVGAHFLRLMDTAGLRQTSDAIEQIGIDRTIQSIDKADIIILVIDPTADTDPQILAKINDALNASPEVSLLVIINKTDLASPDQVRAARQMVTTSIPDRYLNTSNSGENSFAESTTHSNIIEISARNNTGVDAVHTALQRIASERLDTATDAVITNIRHQQELTLAAESAQTTIDALHAGIPGDLTAQHLRATIAHLSSLTGQITSQTLLQTIFSRFCIGK